MNKETRKKYPADWEQISLRIRSQRAKNKCEHCGGVGGEFYKNNTGFENIPASDNIKVIIDNYRKKFHANFKTACKQFKVHRCILTVAHLDHNPSNNSDENLRCLCIRCHLIYDSHGLEWLQKKQDEQKKQVQLLMFYD